MNPVWRALVCALCVLWPSAGLAAGAGDGSAAATAAVNAAAPATTVNQNVAQGGSSYYRKLWIRCGNEKGGVPFRVGNANPGGSRVEGDATDVEGSREWSWKGSRRAAF